MKFNRRADFTCEEDFIREEDFCFMTTSFLRDDMISAHDFAFFLLRSIVRSSTICASHLHTTC